MKGKQDMRKYLFYAAMMLCAMPAITACCDDEDTTPSEYEQNLFSPADSDQSQSAQLRRQFKQEVGCYLLFNDTLRHEQNGTDTYGNILWNTQLVDLTYMFIGSPMNSTMYTFKYLNNYNEQKKASDLLKEKLAKRLGKALPYSILLVDSISQWTNSSGAWELDAGSTWSPKDPFPKYVLGTRCYAFALHGTEAFDDEAYFDDILLSIVIDKINHLPPNKLDRFLSYVAAYFDEIGNPVQKSSLGYDDYATDHDAARTLGFWEDRGNYYFTIGNEDRDHYIEAALTYSVAEVEEMMAGYPIVIERFKIMRQLIIDEFGINLK